MGIYVDRLTARLRLGNVLCACRDDSPDGIRRGGLMFWTEPDGKKARCDAAKDMIAGNFVEPQNDGLFSNTTQSWRLKI